MPQQDLEITIDQRTYDQLRRDLIGLPEGVNKAMAGGIKKAAAQGRTIAVEELFEILNLKSRTPLRQRVTLPKSISTAGGAKSEAVIRLSKKRIGLGNFAGTVDTRDRKQAFGHGVNVKLYRSGEIINFPRAFTGKYRGKGAVLVRKRAGVKGSRGKHGPGEVVNSHFGALVPRYPIFALVGKSPSHVAEKHDQVLTEAARRIRKVLREQLLSQVDRLLKRRKVDRPSDEQT